MKSTPAIICAAVMAAFALTGCTTESVVTEFDQAGNIVKVTKSSKDPFDKITESTKDKTVVAWSNGWAAYIRASSITAESPTPTGEIYAGKLAKGVLTLHKDQTNADKIPAIIAATREDISVDFSGIKSTSGNDEAEEPAAAPGDPHNE